MFCVAVPADNEDSILPQRYWIRFQEFWTEMARLSIVEMEAARFHHWGEVYENRLQAISSRRKGTCGIVECTSGYRDMPDTDSS